MKRLLMIFGIATVLMGADGPRYTPDGQMIRPDDYREWIFLSAGLGMTYGPLKAEANDANPPFDNVFVTRDAYRAFLKTGVWPDKTVMALEVRTSQSKASINQGGHFQADRLGLEFHVKDESRFPGKWAFFGFRDGVNTAKAIPRDASCYSCHADHGAVDTTFVQFYPTLIPVAKEKGTFQAAEGAVHAEAAVQDVVCGMMVNPKTTAFRAQYQGKTYYFDGADCKAAFEKTPTQYLKGAAK